MWLPVSLPNMTLSCTITKILLLIMPDRQTQSSIYNLRVDLHICLLSPLKRHDVRRQNFACRHVPSVCNTWAGSYVDRVHHYDKIYFRQLQHDIHLTKGKQLAECHIPCTVPSANIFTIQRVCGHRQITFSADSAWKAQDGARSAIGIQAETKCSDVLACYNKRR